MKRGINLNILSVENITHSFTERKLFDKASFYLHEGDKVGVIGINGTGKSTLLKIMAGIEEPDEGKVIKASNLMIHYLPQNPKFNDEDTVIESVQNMVHHHANENELIEAKSMMTRLGITDFEQKTGELSGGQRKRLALVSVLLTPCDILILDEPTNHLDIKYQIEILSLVKSLDICVVAALHDLALAAQFCNEIYLIKNGELRACGKPKDIITTEMVKEIYEIDCDIVYNERTSTIMISYYPLEYK